MTSPPVGGRVIVSAADSDYFTLLQSLVRSIRDRPESAGIDLAILDLGLEPDQLAWLAEQDATAVPPDPCLFEGGPERFKGFWCRPLLPRCVPGYGQYLWIDADAWVQDWAAVDLAFEAASGGALSIVASFDRGYDELIPDLGLRTRGGFVFGLYGWTVDSYRHAFGRRAALRLALKPTLNTGVFALRADALHWEAWGDCYRQARGARERFGFDQIALTYAVFERGLETALLPTWCNWVCSRGLPKCDQASGLLVEPHPPHTTLGIVHLIRRKGQPEVELAALGGGTVRRALTYG